MNTNYNLNDEIEMLLKMKDLKKSPLPSKNVDEQQKKNKEDVDNFMNFLNGCLNDVVDEDIRTQNLKTNSNFSSKLKEISEVITPFIDMFASDEYETLKTSLIDVLDVFSSELISTITCLYQTVYDESEEIDRISAESLFRKYHFYFDAGFTEEQAFKLIMSEKDNAKSMKALIDAMNSTTSKTK